MDKSAAMNSMNAGYDQFDNLQDYSGGNAAGNPQVSVYPQGQRYSAQPVNNFTVVVDKPNYPWCTLVTSVISVFFCTCFGIAALVMSLLSYTDHHSNRVENSRSKRQVACGLATAGIVLGSLITVVLIAVNAYLISSAVSEAHDSFKDFNSNY